MAIRNGTVVAILLLLSGMACSAASAGGQSSAGFIVGRRGLDARSVQRNVDVLFKLCRGR